jgi:multiple sugar transport system permease protein
MAVHRFLDQFMKNKFVYIANATLTLLFLLPFVWTISTSLKKSKDIIKYPPEWVPSDVTFEHYNAIWHMNNNSFQNYLLNTVILTTLAVLIIVLIGGLAGYGFSKLTIPFKKLFLLLILTALMIPFHTLLIPLFTMMKNLNLLNTHIALIIIYVTFHLPVAVFMMVNSFDAIPDAIRESALMDGAGEFRIFSKLMIPLAWPGLATVAIYSAYTTWNDYIVALVFTTTDDMRTLNIGLTNMAIGQYGNDWGLLTAGSIINFLPMIILFIFLQRFFISGLANGAVK